MAEDLLQETLLAAWRGIELFDRRSSLRTWLYRIATNRCLNALSERPWWRRSLSRRNERDVAQVLAAAAGGPPDLAAIGEVMHRHGLAPAQPVAT